MKMTVLHVGWILFLRTLDPTSMFSQEDIA